MRRVVIATSALLLLFVASSLIHAGDITQKGTVSQKDVTQMGSTQKGSTQKWSTQKSSTQKGHDKSFSNGYDKGSTQKGYDKGGKSSSCDCRGHHSWFHCKKFQAPRAPIMGSAPAMMAPVILVQNQQQRAPNEDKPEDEIERLKKILEALDDLIPERKAATAPRAAAQNDADAMNQILKLLQKQDERIAKQKEAQAKLSVNHDEAMKLLKGLGSQLKKLEKRVEGDEAMKEE